ncbi:unnamed protein product, partial [Closterium sp. NIES-53]
MAPVQCTQQGRTDTSLPFDGPVTPIFSSRRSTATRSRSPSHSQSAARSSSSAALCNAAAACPHLVRAAAAMRGCAPSRGATCARTALRRHASASPHRLRRAPRAKRLANPRGNVTLGVALLLLAAVAAAQAATAAGGSARRYTIAPLRGLDERVEVFTLAERLLFAGTAVLPPMHDSDDAAAGSSSARDGAGGGHSGGGDNGGGGESERDGSSESGREQDSSSANDGASDQGTQGSDPGGGGTDITPDGSSSSSGGSSSGSGTSGAAGEGDPSEAVEQRNEHAIRRIRYPQGARQGDMRAGERGGGSADAGGEAAAAAQPSAPAPASAPAVAVDPLEEQFVSGELTLAVLHQAQAHTLTLTRTRTRAHVRRPPACAALNACHTIPSTPSKLCRTTPQRRSPSPTPHHSSPGQVQQLARAGVVAARETEVKAVVRRRAAVGFPGISQYSEVNSGTAPTYNHSVVREKNDSPCLSFLVWTGYHTARWSGGTWDRHLPLLLASITHCSFVASVVSSCGAAAGVCEWHGMAWHGCGGYG